MSTPTTESGKTPTKCFTDDYRRNHAISIPGRFAIAQEGSIGGYNRWGQKTETIAFCLRSLQVLVSVMHSRILVSHPPKKSRKNTLKDCSALIYQALYIYLSSVNEGLHHIRPRKNARGLATRFLISWINGDTSDMNSVGAVPI